MLLWGGVGSISCNLASTEGRRVDWAPKWLSFRTSRAVIRCPTSKVKGVQDISLQVETLWILSEVQLAGGTVTMWRQPEGSLDAEVCCEPFGNRSWVVAARSEAAGFRW